MVLDFSFESALFISKEDVFGDIISLSTLLKKEENLIKLLPCTEEEFDAGEKYLEEAILREKGLRLKFRQMGKKERKRKKELRNERILDTINFIKKCKENGWEEYIDKYTTELQELRSQKLDSISEDYWVKAASKRIAKLKETYHVFFEGGYENLRENILEEIRKNREEIKKQLSL